MSRRRVSIVDQLIRARLQLIAVFAVVVGVVAETVSRWPDAHSFGEWLRIVVLPELGLTLAVAGLVSVWIDYANRGLGDRRGVRLFRRALQEETPVVRVKVPSVEVLKTCTPEELDTLARTVDEVRFGADDYVRDITKTIRDEASSIPERWRNVSVTVDLLPWEVGPSSGPGSMFTATVQWDYATVPADSELRFVCVSDKDEYHALTGDPAVTQVWRFGQTETVDAGSPEAFELVSVTVDDQDCPIQRARRAGSQTYTATVPPEVIESGREVSVTAIYRVLVARWGRYLFLTTPRPSYGFTARLNYSRVGIWQATPEPFIVGMQRPRITKTSAAAPARSVGLGLDGWIQPGCGVTFGWIVNDETHR